MSVLIRLTRVGRKNRPSYRINVADSRYPLDGRVIESIGVYDPIAPRPELRMKVDAERARHWIGVGAQVSDTVRSVFNKLGVYQGVTAPKRRERTGRKQTKTHLGRVAAKNARLEAKAQRLVTRIAAKKALKAAGGPPPVDKKKDAAKKKAK
jgi:small subunit ribosomal protein S16